MGGLSKVVGSVFGGGDEIAPLDPAQQVEKLEFGGQLAPTAIPASLGGQELAQAFQEGGAIEGEFLGQAIGEQRAGLQGARDLFGQTEAQFDPFIQGGQGAFSQQAALSGAQGPEAQARAIQGIQVSPGQQFLRDRAEKALLRNAAATGDLGGGRTRLGLQEQAIGFGAQDIENQFNRLGQVSQQGLGALGSLASQRQNLGQQGLGVSSNISNILGQQGAVGGQALRGAAGALSDEQIRQLQASQNQFTQLAQQQGVENQFNLGQQQVEFQNIANQLGVDQANIEIARQNAANEAAGINNLLGAAGAIGGFALGGPAGAALGSQVGGGGGGPAIRPSNPATFTGLDFQSIPNFRSPTFQ